MTIWKKCSKIVIYWSMTVSHYSWVIAENCHWPVNDSFALQLGNCRKLSLTSQWQYGRSVQKLSLTGQWQFRITVGLSQKIVIDQSMTIWKKCSKIVIDWSMTVSHYSWVIAENCHWPVNDSLQEVFKNCHLLVNDSFALQLGNCRKLSLTGQWQFRITVG